MRSKVRITVTLDSQCVKAINHMVKKKQYKSVSNAVEQLITRGMNMTPHDNFIDAILTELKKL